MKKQILALSLIIFGNLAQAQTPVEELTAKYVEGNFATIIIAVLPELQIFCGYSDVNSEINRALYADSACQFFGLRKSVGHKCGWTKDQRQDRVRVLGKDGAKVVIPAPDRSVGFYSELTCIR